MIYAEKYVHEVEFHEYVGGVPYDTPLRHHPILSSLLFFHGEARHRLVPGPGGRIRTFEEHSSTDLQSVPIGHSGTPGSVKSTLYHFL